MNEALRVVRSTLGSDALIMETKNVNKESGGGIEIIALVEGELADDLDADETETAAPISPPVNDIRQELEALRSMLRWLTPGFDHTDRIFATLLRQGLAPEALGKLTDAMKNVNSGDEHERLCQALAQLIPRGGQVRDGRDRLAFLGPTGAGKTTGLIKLTIFELQRRQCCVGWIAMDQRQLATGDPLAVYAGILGVPYEKASDSKELQKALERLSYCDLVLVDTPGINPRDNQGIKQLAHLLRNVPDVRRALLLSAATNEYDMAEWVAIYRHDGLHSLILTKLDECRYLGPAINTVLACGLPISYLTLGQNLTGDLTVAESQVLANLLLTGADFHDSNQHP